MAGLCLVHASPPLPTRNKMAKQMPKHRISLTEVLQTELRRIKIEIQLPLRLAFLAQLPRQEVLLLWMARERVAQQLQGQQERLTNKIRNIIPLLIAWSVIPLPLELITSLQCLDTIGGITQE
jgi:hypothetical protein